MIIKSAKCTRVEHLFCVTVTHKRIEYAFNVKTCYGKVIGDHNNNLMAASLNYFELPEPIRKRHFTQIKKYLENK